MIGKMSELNLRDLGAVCRRFGHEGVPEGVFLRGGKLGLLSPEECGALCRKYGVRCVVDLRTPVESNEFPDSLPDGVEYLQVPLLRDAAVGITHETGSDPMTIIRNLRKHPEKLKEMIPDFGALYHQLVTDVFSRGQLEKVVNLLRENAQAGKCTLFHCTAGKDRTGVVSMALLKSYGVSDQVIVRDYMLTNRNAFFPTLRKCIGIALITWNWSLVKIAYRSFMADRELIEAAIRDYDGASSTGNQ